MKELPPLLPERLASHIEDHFIRRPFSIMYEMEKYARQEKIPILDPIAGPLLTDLVQRFQPKKTLELGTSIGYSCLWIFAGSIEVHITTIDREILVQKRAEKYFHQANITRERYTLITGDVLQYLQTHKELLDYDLIFIDCDKIRYPFIWDELINNPLLRNKKILIDNVLWHGRILAEHNKPSDLRVKEFWQKVLQSGLKQTLFTNGDGLLLVEL